MDLQNFKDALEAEALKAGSMAANSATTPSASPLPALSA